ncbi:threonine--tRNA ligase, mitochondrial 1, partial [Tanacetum coccineum]
LSDGTVKEGKKWETTPFDIAKELSKSSSNALISRVNGALWDMSRPLESDCQLKIFTFDSDEGRDTFWHSSAHILGQALEQTYGCKLCIGPCTTRGEGFFYDAFYGELGLNDDHFDAIVSGAKKAVAEKQPFERIEVSREQALEMFSDNKFKASAAYWRGNKDRESLQRVYGISYLDQKRLKVETPNMCNMKLWETSGHAANYKENMFVFNIDNEEFALKPMNCPGHCVIFNNRPRSYRELPLRIAEFGVIHRNEASGALTGLTCDDAHIFCRESQIKDEVKSVLEFVSCACAVFGFTFDLKLSTRPENYLGDLETWDKAEKALADALNEFGKPWQINEADGAFYGPKIDIYVSDAMKRNFQCSTLQVKELIDAAGYYVDIDSSDRTIQKKVREAQLAQYNYILVVGKKEVETKQ